MTGKTILTLLLLLLSLHLSFAQEQRAIGRVKKVNVNHETSPLFDGYRYRALLIGNNHYQHWDNLQTPIHDVEELAELIKGSYGFLEEDVILLRDATRREILQAFRDLKLQGHPEDHLLVYYAGHGFSDSNSTRGYWVPVDAADDLDYLPNEVIRKELEVINAKHKLLIADSCFSGTFVTTQRSLGEELNWREKGYYVNKSADPSFQTLTSGSNEPVFDGGAAWGGHSIFAYHLLSKLRYNKQPYLPAKRLGQHLEEQVSNDVAASLGSKQTPIFSAIYPGHAGGEFFFLKKGHGVQNVIFRPTPERSRPQENSEQKILMIYHGTKDAKFENIFHQAKDDVFVELAEILSTNTFQVLKRTAVLDTVGPQKISDLLLKNSANWGLVLSFDGRLEQQQNFLWKGVALATLQVEIWRKNGGQPQQVGVWNPDLQKLPSRQWKDDTKFQEKLIGQALKKVLEKADTQTLKQLFKP